jgi:hypothetical protein
MVDFQYSKSQLVCQKTSPGNKPENGNISLSLVGLERWTLKGDKKQRSYSAKIQDTW